MPTFDFDLFVIGGGSGGVRAARMAAQQGARVGLAEAAELGGTCVNVGCIPKKLYSYAAGYAESFEESAGYGWKLPEAPQFDWAYLKTQRAKEIGAAQRRGVRRAAEEFRRHAGSTGWARPADGHTVRGRRQAPHGPPPGWRPPAARPTCGRCRDASSIVTLRRDVRDLRPFPKAPAGGGRRLHRLRVRVDLQRPGRRRLTQLHRRAHPRTGFDDDVLAVRRRRNGQGGRRGRLR